MRKIFHDPRILVLVIFLGIGGIISLKKQPDSIPENTGPPTSQELFTSKSQTFEEGKGVMASKAGAGTNLPIDPYANWIKVHPSSGSRPDCFNLKPRYHKHNKHRLEVSVGYGADVAIKLMRNSDNLCIRYVYVRAGDSYTIKKIPPGDYYLKLAYGHDWRQTDNVGKCKGKFVGNALYKRGDNILSFTKTIEEAPLQNRRTISYSYYRLSLDVVTIEGGEGYSTNSISEEEFNL